jgi:hypothetical protein
MVVPDGRIAKAPFTAAMWFLPDRLATVATPM